MTRLLLIWLLIVACTPAAVAQNRDSVFRVDQEGYYPFAPKWAVVLEADHGDSFFVISSTGTVAFRGVLGSPIASQNSSLVTRLADFSGLTAVGNYHLQVPGLGNSFSFSIKKNIHAPVAVGSLKAFYFQRSNMPLANTFAGAWARPAGHADTVVLIHPSAATAARPALTVISSPGGWYDAGDYNKYIVNSGITMGTMMSAYEDFGEYFRQLNINIPETGDGVPDMLNEVLYNLRWMLTMQDPADGGVYHKCTNAGFDGMVMPGITTLPRYVVMKGTAATLDFAAVMAQAARIFRAFGRQYPALADSCLLAARKAWQWSVQHPSIVYDQTAMNATFEPKITTGAYGDQHFADEFFWAAAELFCTTREEEFSAAIESKVDDRAPLPSWGNVYGLGLYSLLRNKSWIANKDSLLINRLKSHLIQMAEALLHPPAQGPQQADSRATAFHTVMGGRRSDFVWGSTAVCANQGILLINAWLNSGRQEYLTAALGNLDWLLGSNATGYCFVTGFGSQSPRHPHHRPSVADGIEAPVPGLMAGGPNPGMQDHTAYPFKEAERAWVDNDQAYASNEIAINWNAALVYLVNALEALQYKAGFSK